MSNKELIGILGGLWNARTPRHSHCPTIFHCTYRNCRRLIQALFWKLEWEVQYEKLKLAHQISMAEDVWKQSGFCGESWPDDYINQARHSHSLWESQIDTLTSTSPTQISKKFHRVEINWMFHNDIRCLQWGEICTNRGDCVKLKGADVSCWQPSMQKPQRFMNHIWIWDLEFYAKFHPEFCISSISAISLCFWSNLSANISTHTKNHDVKLYFDTLTYFEWQKSGVSFWSWEQLQQCGVAKLWVSRGYLG